MKTTDYRGNASEVLVQTVTLSKNAKDPFAAYIFHCFHCGKQVNKIQGEVRSIVAGLIPTNEVTSISQCIACGENYTFQSVKSDRSEIRLILSRLPEDRVSSFHCVICRSILAKYDDMKVTLIPWMTVHTTPCVFTCFNPTCDRQYRVNEIVTSVVS